MIIRAIAVWSLAKVAIALPGSVVGYRSMEPQTGFGPGWFLAAAALGILAITALWLFADKLAKLALVRPQDMTFESDLAPTTWLGILLSAIGAWLFFEGVVFSVYRFTRWMILLRFGPELDSIPDTWADIASIGVQLILGAVLVLRGQGLSRWIHRMRYGVEQAAVRPTE
ncbi:hypothetical protein QLQ15_00875 [Lysobacter sp. LF1]|uniref:DUF2975 domain-containing protein n=1 Tax=Lysobacter stagni TaxID=3045172 RepID=A0ABT6XBF3_9GAMM|nr:hypothetical protein [Lysobacter sp. LF1]MDI9237464.1 hypothetical protein [Lysobacter sp. LF1]